MKEFAVKYWVLWMFFAGGMLGGSGTLSASEPVEWLVQCEQYEEDVKAILEEEGISTDFYYLMVIESRCTPKARSKRGATGFWQLMPGTSKHYGCDNPDDLECSTRAAAKYIRRLQSEFKDFDSVIAAYNMGGHNLKQNGMNISAKKLVGAVKKLRRDSQRASALSQKISDTQKEKIFETMAAPEPIPVQITPPVPEIVDKPAPVLPELNAPKTAGDPPVITGASDETVVSEGRMEE